MKARPTTLKRGGGRAAHNGRTAQDMRTAAAKKLTLDSNLPPRRRAAGGAGPRRTKEQQPGGADKGSADKLPQQTLVLQTKQQDKGAGNGHGRSGADHPPKGGTATGSTLEDREWAEQQMPPPVSSGGGVMNSPRPTGSGYQ